MIQTFQTRSSGNDTMFQSTSIHNALIRDKTLLTEMF